MEKNEFINALGTMTILKILMSQQEEWSIYSDTPKQLVELRIPEIFCTWIKRITEEVGGPEAELMSCVITHLIQAGIQEKARDLLKNPKLVCEVCPTKDSCDKKEETCQSLKPQ